jgi:CII-binding regulator of phage lambda lysogenization HflD
MLQGLIQRTLDEVRTFREETRTELRRLGGRMTLLERRLTKQGTEAIEDLQGQIDDLAERVSHLEAP